MAMALPMAKEHLMRRQLGGTNRNGTSYGYENPNNSWWWTPAGLAVRYSIVAILFGALLLFFCGGYYHAQHRVRKGKAPLGYHRWMLRPARPISLQPPPSRPRYTRYADPNRDGYQMEGYPPPPPAYHQQEAPPPTYAPPPGASKTMADQNYREVNAEEAGEGSAGGSASASANGGNTAHT